MKSDEKDIDLQSAETGQAAGKWAEGMTTGFIPVDGGKVFYRMYGADRPGTPVIFIHGGPGCGCDYYYKQTPIGKDRPVVFYNQLGSAGSDIAEEYTRADQVKKLFTVERFVEELDTVVKFFGFDNFVLCGHSWGTMLALEYAAAKHPGGLKGIIMAGPYLKTETWIEDAERLIRTLPDGDHMWSVIQECDASGIYTEEHSRIMEVYARNFYSRVPGAMDGTPEEPPTRVVDGVDVYTYMWGPADFSCTGILKGRDSTPLLKEVQVPIMYLCGEYDNGSPEAAVYYRSMTINGEICVLPGCAHDMTRERPEEFNAVVNAFASRVGDR
ncbi:MAG: proline iminopeptidase-family hydrolase [Eubacterium sp.]|nr:proline iminopeptidase-family hydrolase [Eubacterium sp.]